MDWQYIGTATAAVLFAVIGWLLRTLWEAVDNLRENLRKLEHELPHIYARRDDVREMFNQLLEELRRLRIELYGNHNEK